MSDTGIPPVFIEAAKEANENLEGWSYNPANNGISFLPKREGDSPPPITIKQYADGNSVSVQFEVVASRLPLPAALRLANALVRALEGDTVTEADIVDGIRFRIGDGWNTVASLNSEWARIDEGDAALICLPAVMVADMLNGCIRRGEEITWPEGHRLAPPTEAAADGAENGEGE